MLKEALEYLVKVNPLKQLEINGLQYANRSLAMIAPPTASAMPCSTLQGVIDYFDTGEMHPDAFINIERPDCVRVVGPLSAYKTRDHFLVAKAYTTNFRFGQYYSVEDFIISLKTCFQDYPEDLWQTVSFVRDNSIAEIKDDGISQSLKIETGVRGGVDMDIKGEFHLAPYRTFPDIPQPVSLFFLRIRKDGNEIKIALHQSDDSKWMNEAVASIKRFFTEKISALVV